MGDFADTVSSLMTDAGKTSNADRQQAERAVRRTIQAINRSLSNWSVASRSNVSVASGAKNVTLPSTCKRVNELGCYDSSTDRIISRYEEIDERYFNDNYGGVTTISSVEPTGYNEFFFVDDLSTGERVIRLVYPPNAAFTLMATYYEKLSESNVDRFDDSDLLYSGAIARMPGWFPSIASMHFKLYEDAINEKRGERRSSKRHNYPRQSPQIELHNAIMSQLTQ